MDIKQSATVGVYLGISNKKEIFQSDSYKARQNYNTLIMAKAGRGMSYAHKAALVSELNKNEKRVF